MTSSAMHQQMQRMKKKKKNAPAPYNLYLTVAPEVNWWWWETKMPKWEKTTPTWSYVEFCTFNDLVIGVTPKRDLWREYFEEIMNLTLRQLHYWEHEECSCGKSCRSWWHPPRGTQSRFSRYLTAPPADDLGDEEIPTDQKLGYLVKLQKKWDLSHSSHWWGIVLSGSPPSTWHLWTLTNVLYLKHHLAWDRQCQRLEENPASTCHPRHQGAKVRPLPVGSLNGTRKAREKLGGQSKPGEGRSRAKLLEWPRLSWRVLPRMESAGGVLYVTSMLIKLWLINLWPVNFTNYFATDCENTAYSRTELRLKATVYCLYKKQKT